MASAPYVGVHCFRAVIIRSLTGPASDRAGGCASSANPRERLSPSSARMLVNVAEDAFVITQRQTDGHTVTTFSAPATMLAHLFCMPAVQHRKPTAQTRSRPRPSSPWLVTGALQVRECRSEGGTGDGCGGADTACACQMGGMVRGACCGVG